MGLSALLVEGGEDAAFSREPEACEVFLPPREEKIEKDKIEKKIFLAQMTVGDIFRIILAFILPPFAVATQVGFSGAFWLNLVFWLLSFGALGLPVMGIMWPVAIVHAITIIITRR